MKEHYDFECTPYDEKCVQVTKEGEYMPAMRAEAKRMKEICSKLWPDVEFGLSLNSHDFGSYLSLRITFDADDEKMWDRINEIEREWPETWDEAYERIVIKGVKV